jgi:hypothetical protein
MLAAACTGTTVALAQSGSKTNLNGSSVNTITTAVPFLRISPDARSGAMGDVGVAIAPDANSQFWNIGKMPFAPKKIGISATYTPWLKDLVPDINLAYVAGYIKFGPDQNQAISSSLRYFSLGDINFTDVNAQPLGTGKPREFSFDVGYSRKLSPYLSTGISLRYIHSAIANGLGSGSAAGTDYKPGNAVAADIGLFYTKTKEIDGFRTRTFNFGGAITNLGSKMSYSSTRRDFIPTNLGLGVAQTWQFDEYNKFTLSADANKLLVPTPQVGIDSASGNQYYYYPDKTVVSGVLGSFSDAPGGFSEEIKEWQLSAGAEYWYQNQFALRAGYFYENKDKGDRKYFTVGGGVRYNIFNINFSYLVPSGTGINRNPLANTFRFTLLFEFDKFKSADESTSTGE